MTDKLPPWLSDAEDIISRFERDSVNVSCPLPTLGTVVHNLIEHLRELEARIPKPLSPEQRKDLDKFTELVKEACEEHQKEVRAKAKQDVARALKDLVAKSRPDLPCWFCETPAKWPVETMTEAVHECGTKAMACPVCAQLLAKDHYPCWTVAVTEQKQAADPPAYLQSLETGIKFKFEDREFEVVLSETVTGTMPDDTTELRRNFRKWYSGPPNGLQHYLNESGAFQSKMDAKTTGLSRGEEIRPCPTCPFEIRCSHCHNLIPMTAETTTEFPDSLRAKCPTCGSNTHLSKEARVIPRGVIVKEPVMCPDCNSITQGSVILRRCPTCADKFNRADFDCGKCGKKISIPGMKTEAGLTLCLDCWKARVASGLSFEEALLALAKAWERVKPKGNTLVVSCPGVVPSSDTYQKLGDMAVELNP